MAAVGIGAIACVVVAVMVGLGSGTVRMLEVVTLPAVVLAVAGGPTVEFGLLDVRLGRVLLDKVAERLGGVAVGAIGSVNIVGFVGDVGMLGSMGVAGFVGVVSAVGAVGFEGVVSAVGVVGVDGGAIGSGADGSVGASCASAVSVRFRRTVVRNVNEVKFIMMVDRFKFRFVF